MSGNNQFHRAVLCGHADALLAMSRRGLRDVLTILRCAGEPLPHPFFNNHNSREQATVHMVAELGSYHSASSILRAPIVSVGTYIDFPRGSDPFGGSGQ